MRAIRPWGLLLALATAVPATAEEAPVVVNGVSYATWSDYFTSDTFREEGRRCGTVVDLSNADQYRDGTFCQLASTTIDPLYEPANGDLYEIRVVVHVITNSAGTQGNIPDPLIDSQIQVLNEDFRAILGSNGEPGTDAKIQFTLAGITRSANDTWFNDGGAYYNSLAWDPNLYLNIYTNQAGGNLGYVPFLPQGGAVGSLADRVVCHWTAFGSPGLGGPPYDLGRTATHEVGHYLGLHHTFNGGCSGAAAPGCYTSGDYICDTLPEQSPEFGCSTAPSCGDPDPIHNYMDYSVDSCMNQFTPEQSNRIRCTLINYRPNLLQPVVAVGSPADSRSMYMLAQNRPNPFNPTTEISFEVGSEGPVSLVVMDVTGRIIRTLASGTYEAGEHRVSWDGRGDAAEDMASGVYFYRLRTNEGSQTRRMILLK